MTLERLTEILEAGVGIPVVYAKSKVELKAPYIVLVGGHENHKHADNKIIDITEDVDIELYTSDKNLELENKIKMTLIKNNILYEKDQDVIEKDWIKTNFEVKIKEKING